MWTVCLLVSYVRAAAPVGKNMSWDTEKTISFIKEYEKRPILWKKDDKHYYNIIRKEDAWREIGEIFNESVDDLKKKIDSLRGSRRREKNRIAKSMGTGKGRNEIYESKWFAWDSLKFLDDPEELQGTLSNHPASSDIIEVDEETTDNPDRIVEDQNPISSQKKFLSPHKNAPKRKKNEDPRIQEAYDILKSRTATQSKDECSMFADFIAQKMRKFSPYTRAVLQHQIHNLIFQAELESLPISPQLLSASQQTFQPSTSIYQNFRTYNSLPSPSSSISSVGPPSCTPSPLQSPQSNIQQYNEHAPQQSYSEHSSNHSQEVPHDHQEITSENSLISQLNSSQRTANQLTTATYFSKYDEI